MRAAQLSSKAALPSADCCCSRAALLRLAPAADKWLHLTRFAVIPCQRPAPVDSSCCCLCPSSSAQLQGSDDFCQLLLLSCTANSPFSRHRGGAQLKRSAVQCSAVQCTTICFTAGSPASSLSNSAAVADHTSSSSPVTSTAADSLASAASVLRVRLPGRAVLQLASYSSSCSTTSRWF
jgi:hypothetical protein